MFFDLENRQFCQKTPMLLSWFVTILEGAFNSLRSPYARNS